MHSFFVPILLVALLGSGEGDNHARFAARGIGQIDVTTAFPIGGFPTANFRSGSGDLLLSVEVGTGDPGLFRIEPPDRSISPELSYLGPTVVTYFVIRPLKQAKAVLVIAKYTGGSDCAYASSVVGVTSGRLKTWFQQRDIVNSQGGVYIGDLGDARGFGLAAWTDLWEDGGHYSNHRYRLRLYQIDLASGTSRLIFDRSTKRKHAPKDALQEFGVRYKNFFAKSNELGC